jgi:DNA-binding transcriptional MerR regulator
MTKFTDYLHTAAAAEHLGVAHNTIRKWAARGDVPIHRNPVNGCRLFKRSDPYTFLQMTARPIKVIK